MWEYKAQLRRVVDADTIDVTIDCGFSIYLHERLRLGRIDAWEIRGAEKPEGDAAKLALIGKLSEYDGQLVVKTTPEKGKYGRYIAEIEVGEGSTRTNVNDWLVEQGHAVYKEY